MNERFEKLLAEAFFDEAADQADTKVYELNDAMMQKFAELIVRECADIFEGVYTDQQRPERIDTRIKQHFGVEE
jgi:hypothetical protein